MDTQQIPLMIRIRYLQTLDLFCNKKSIFVHSFGYVLKVYRTNCAFCVRILRSVKVNINICTKNSSQFPKNTA